MEETRTKLSSLFHRMETRTKLSSKACPFRPSLDSASVSTTATICSGFAAYSSESALDSSAGSVGSWSSGQLLVAMPLPTSPAYPGVSPRDSATPCAEDGQGAADSPQSDKGQFKLGDFRTKLLKRAHAYAAQTQAPQEPRVRRADAAINFANSSWSEVRDAWIKQALVVESRNSAVKGCRPESSTVTGASERRKAMCQCVQRPQLSDLEHSSESKGLPAVPLQHAATFNEGTPLKQEVSAEADLLPVKRTFIHFPDNDGPKDSGFQWSSAPAIMMTSEHCSKYPKMEAAHIRGECRPCFYNTNKSDGCRWGGDCEFCHLCPPGSVQKKKSKERLKALREQKVSEKCFDRQRCVNWVPAA